MDTMSYIIGRNSAGGGGTGSTPSWSDVTNKPFETVGTGLTVTAGALQATGSSSVDWSDVQNKPSFATVAISGDYGDLSNKPTIPTVPTDVSDFNNDAGYITTADVANTIDNKSLVFNQQGKLQEAVPVYTEEVYHEATETYGTGLLLTDFTYPSQVDIDSVITTDGGGEFVFNTTQNFYNVYISIDGIVHSGTWTAASDGGYYAGGNTLLLDGAGYELYVDDSESNLDNDYRKYRFHVFLDGRYISGSGSEGNVDWLLIAPSSTDPGFQNAAEYVGKWSTKDNAYTETVIHKLPEQYYDKGPEVIVDGYNGDVLYEEDGVIRSKYLYSNYSLNIDPSSNAIGLELKNNTKKYDSSMQEFGHVWATQITYNDGLNGALLSDNDIINYIISNFSEDTHCLLSLNAWNYSPDYFPYIYGELSWTDPSDASTCVFSGFEQYLTFEHNSTQGGWVIKRKDNEYFYAVDLDTSSYSEPVKMNSRFLPIDNSTIKRDSDGNITTAIPAPPTTDGNYTLAVTVTNGEPTYSWV